jgi:hypothetical protein
MSLYPAKGMNAMNSRCLASRLPDGWEIQGSYAYMIQKPAVDEEGTIFLATHEVWPCLTSRKEYCWWSRSLGTLSPAYDSLTEMVADTTFA